jgi:ABC-type Na+ efflux pump permease subunit
VLRDAWFLARYDLRRMFRSRETWLWSFIMPVVFFYFIGTITGNQYRSIGPNRDAIAVTVPADAGFLADHLIRRLEQRDYRVVRGADTRGFTRILEIPPGFTASVLASRPAKIKVTRTSEGLGGDYDDVRLARAVYQVLADVIVAGRQGAVTQETLHAVEERPRTLTVEVTAAGKRRRVPSGFEQSVPGSLVMFVLLVMFTVGGVSLVVERNQGLLRRLASAPMSRGAVTLGKWASRFGLGVVQVVFAMLAGTVLFRLSWGPNLPFVFLVLLAYSALASLLSMLLGTYCRTEGQVIGVGVISSNLMAALGGCWWPIEITPEWAQKMALAFPTGWTMDALHQLISFGAAPSRALPNLAGLLAATVLAGWLIARHFRFQ